MTKQKRELGTVPLDEVKITRLPSGVVQFGLTMTPPADSGEYSDKDIAKLRKKMLKRGAEVAVKELLK